MRPVPVVFHLGPLQVHTYGIGLAITFWFAYRYLARRLRAHGYPDAWLGGTFVIVVVASIAGARAVHVLANLSHYEHQPAQVFAVWQGGLSSFGGLALGVPAGLWSAHRRCPELRTAVAADVVAPVLAIAWALGRLLGPQLMVAGGGKPTSAWFGMYYAGEVGKRLPVPIFQALECLVVYLVALRVERAVRRRGGPVGVVTAVAAALWGLSRVFDESVLLPHDAGSVGVEVASVAFFAVGMAVAALLWRRFPAAGTPPPDPWRPRPVAATAAGAVHAAVAGNARDETSAEAAGSAGEGDAAPVPARR
jgi:phosphatidylglycerol:prolipoprotein diacylglycerol transferase